MRCGSGGVLLGAASREVRGRRVGGDAPEAADRQRLKSARADQSEAGGPADVSQRAASSTVSRISVGSSAVAGAELFCEGSLLGGPPQKPRNTQKPCLGGLSWGFGGGDGLSQKAREVPQK